MDLLSQFDHGTIMKLLQGLHKNAPSLVTVEINIKNVPDVNKITGEQIALAFSSAKENLQEKIPYNVEKSYDCAWLRDTVLRKIADAQKASTQGNTITLENRCCTLDNCPQIMFCRIFVESLQSLEYVHFHNLITP